MPIENTAQFCKDFLAMGKPCHLEYGIFPIILVKQFSVASGETFSGNQTVFVYLSRTTSAENSVPKN